MNFSSGQLDQQALESYRSAQVQMGNAHAADWQESLW